MTETPTSWTNTTGAELIAGSGAIMNFLSQTDTEERKITEAELRTYILNGLNLSGVIKSVVNTLGDLPATGDDNTIYFVKDYDGNGNTNVYLWDSVGTVYVDYPTRQFVTSSPLSGQGTVAAPFTIANAAIALTKLANGTANRLIGFLANGTISEITVGSGIQLINGVLTAATGSGFDTIDDNYNPGNGVIISCTRNGLDITTTLANGVLTITIPDGERIQGGRNYIFVNSSSCTYSNEVSPNSFKVLIDNTANNNEIPAFTMIARSLTSGVSSTASTTNPHNYDINLNADAKIQDMSLGLFSVVFQSLGTRASAGALIQF